MPATLNANPKVIKTEYRSDDAPPVANAVPFITEVSKLTLKPGDVLVVKVDRPLRAEQFRCIKDWLADQLPPDIHTLVLDPMLSLQVVERAEGEG
jgi:hypothetical protein